MPPPKLNRRNTRLHPVDVYVGALIKERRKELGASQARLSQSLGMTFQQIQKYESGINRVSCSILVEIAVVLGVRPSYFLDRATELVHKVPLQQQGN